VNTQSEKYRQWATVLRIISYLSGFAGVAIMMSDMGRSKWSTLSYVFLGIMFAGFIGIYILSALRFMRK